MMDSLYQIGIEIELFLGPSDISFHSQQKLNIVADHIVSKCNPVLPSTAQLRNKVDKPCRRPQYWSFKRENSVVTYEYNSFSLELVSPVLQYNESNTWRDDLREIFQVLSNTCNIRTNNTCGLHIHISPGRGTWGLRTIKELCRNIFYFEEVIDSLVPQHRVGHELIRSSRQLSAQLRDKTARECLTIINRCYSVPQIINVMSDGGSRYFAWNLVNMLPGGRGTIEFRQPPGVENAEDALQWAEFVVLFLHAARRSVSFVTLCRYPQTRDGLREFLSLHELPGSDLSALNRLFDSPPSSTERGPAENHE